MLRKFLVTAALVLSRTWSLNPNQVKNRLTSKARTITGVAAAAQGAGEVDAFAATMSTDLTLANQGVAPALGGGSLQASRGSWCLRRRQPKGLERGPLRHHPDG